MTETTFPIPDTMAKPFAPALVKGGYDGRFQLIPFDAIKFSTGPDYLIKGLIPAEGLGVIWGPPGCGKSFFAFDLAMHIARGVAYRDRRTRQGSCVYIAGEGQSGFKKRVAAYREAHKISAGNTPNFHLLPEPVNLPEDGQALIAAIEAQNASPNIVFLDTLNRTIGGADENSSEGMGNYVKQADAIRTKFNCCVMVIHHCGVAETRPRGHTSLTGAADCQFKVTNTNGVRTVKAEKVKDGEDDISLSFALEVVELGQDDDGDTITSCVVVEAAPNAAIDSKLPKQQANLYRMLFDACANDPTGLTWDQWRSTATENGMSKSTVFEAKTGLLDKGKVREINDRYVINHSADGDHG
ncbi:MAG: AAA family ATPase [Alphaproteobacteria bacterium]|nr:AAA family ATPase [Alphaproteobacteria bacterium]